MGDDALGQAHRGRDQHKDRDRRRAGQRQTADFAAKEPAQLMWRDGLQAIDRASDKGEQRHPQIDQQIGIDPQRMGIIQIQTPPGLGPANDVKADQQHDGDRSDGFGGKVGAQGRRTGAGCARHDQTPKIVKKLEHQPANI